MTYFRIVPERSWVEIHARSSLHPIETRTTGPEGDVNVEIQGGGRVNLKPSPRGTLLLRVERLASGNPLVTRELRRRIDARHYPTIEGELTEMREAADDDRYLVRGDVTFRGVTRTYEEEMTITALDDRTVRLVGEATFDIRDFGMEPPRILMLRVEPEVRVRVHIVAESKA